MEIIPGPNLIIPAVAVLQSQVAVLQSQVAILQTPPCFSVNKNGSDQTGIADVTPTLVTWSTEVYDIGGFFSSNTWTPPAGKIFLHAALYITGTITAGALGVCYIYKNGSPFKQGPAVAGTNFAPTSVSIEDVAGGSDAYTVFAYIDVSASTGTVNGGTDLSYFMGHWISA
jgi:hypothetical protein